LARIAADMKLKHIVEIICKSAFDCWNEKAFRENWHISDELVELVIKSLEIKAKENLKDYEKELPIIQEEALFSISERSKKENYYILEKATFYTVAIMSLEEKYSNKEIINNNLTWFMDILKECHEYSKLKKLEYLGVLFLTFYKTERPLSFGEKHMVHAVNYVHLET